MGPDTLNGSWFQSNYHFSQNHTFYDFGQNRIWNAFKNIYKNCFGNRVWAPICCHISLQEERCTAKCSRSLVQRAKIRGPTQYVAIYRSRGFKSTVKSSRSCVRWSKKTPENGPNMLPYSALGRLSYRQVQSHFFSLAGGHIQGVWGGGAPAWKGMKDHQDPNGAWYSSSGSWSGPTRRSLRRRLLDRCLFWQDVSWKVMICWHLQIDLPSLWDLPGVVLGLF